MRQIDPMHINNPEQVMMEIAIVDSISSEVPSPLMYCPGTIIMEEKDFWTSKELRLFVPTSRPYAMERAVIEITRLIFGSNQHKLLLLKYSLGEKQRTVIGASTNAIPGISFLLDVLAELPESA